MICARCGTVSGPGDNYCGNCGAPLRPALEGGPRPAGASLPVGGGPAAPVVHSNESRYWAVGAHLSALAGGFLGGIPAFLGPLVVWLVRKNDDPFAATHGRAALNFNLSILVYAAALVLFSLVTFGLGVLVTVPLGVLLALWWFVFSLAGAIKAANDEPFRYPLTIPFVK